MHYVVIIDVYNRIELSKVKKRNLTKILDKTNNDFKQHLALSKIYARGEHFCFLICEKVGDALITTFQFQTWSN